jgi:hypothetical protein
MPISPKNDALKNNALAMSCQSGFYSNDRSSGSRQHWLYILLKPEERKTA